MRAGSTAKTVAGALAVVGMLALSSPGVRVAWAEDGDAAASESTPAGVSSGSGSGSCRRGAEKDPRAVRSAVSVQIVDRLRADFGLARNEAYEIAVAAGDEEGRNS